MFKCQECRTQSKLGETPTKVVKETRRKTYENVIKRGKKNFTIRSEGTEIVREVSVGSCCLAKVVA